MDEGKNENAKVNKLIHHLFYNQYIKHLDLIDSEFLKMTVSYLTIEALDSFSQGKKNTREKGFGKSVFKDFFEIKKSLFQVSKTFMLNFIQIFDAEFCIKLKQPKSVEYCEKMIYWIRKAKQSKP